MPDFVARALEDSGLTEAYQARPPYQRNDYLGWIGKAKRDATKQRRLAQMLDELRAGDVYMKMPWRTARSDAPSPEPRLLSGGNPQIDKGDGPEPVRAYLSAMPGWKRGVGEAVDEVVTRVVPHVHKAVRWNSPFYGVEGQGWFLSLHCFDSYVKLTFLNGAHLQPLPPIDMKAPDVRCLHVSEGEPLDRDLLTRWVEQAAALPGDALF